MATQTVTQASLLVLQEGQATDDLVATQVGMLVLTEISAQPNVRLYAASTGDGTTTSLEAWLASFGWIVDTRDDTNLSTDTDLEQFDLILGWRLDSTLTLGDDIRSKAEAAGVPYALLGLDSVAVSDGTGKTFGPNEALLTGTWEVVDSTPGVTDINIVDNTHYITETFSTGLLTISSAATAASAVDDGESTVGDVLGDADDNHANFTTGQAQLIAIETGTDDLAGTPVATTERGLVSGQWSFGTMTDDGDELFERAFTWLLLDKPLRPSIILSSITTTTVNLVSSQFQSVDASRVHAASRWQVTLQTDTTWASPVFDSGYDATNLTSITATGLDAAEDYMARVLHSDDLGQDSEYSIEADFTTSDYGAGGAAGWEIAFYTSGDALISTVYATTESTTYEELITKSIEIPATTAYFEVYPIKRGASSGGAAVKEVSVDRGFLSRGFEPYTFRPEVYTDEVIHATHATSAASGTDVDIDWSLARHQSKTLDSATPALTFSNMEMGTYTLRVVQDGTGSRIPSWPAAVQWASGAAPTLTTTGGAEDLLRFTNIDDTDIVGEVIALNVS